MEVGLATIKKSLIAVGIIVVPELVVGWAVFVTVLIVVQLIAPDFE